VHGANRLGTNSLLDIVVFGRRGGAAMAAYVQDREPAGMPADAEAPTRAAIDALKSSTGTERVADIRARLQEEMTDKASVFRTEESLRSVSGTIAELRGRYRDIAVHDKGRCFNYELTEALELGFLLDLAEALVAAALARTESRGGHFRDDHPLRDDANWMRHSLAFRQPGGGIRLDYKPVVEGPYLPMERKY
jgi:succinate dehydrogenase / fumarate reductase flavoprotein subunit